MIKKSFYLPLFCSFIIFSCATYKAQYADEEMVNYPTDKELERSFYLIGDAGYSPVGGMEPGLKAFSEAVKEGSEKDFAIFLGDNVYPEGMPGEGSKDRKASEYRLDTQLQSIKDFKGRTIFIPGNHDWYNEGVKGIEREEDYIEDALNVKKGLMPSDVCGLDEVEISDDVYLILIDSQWYLEDWDRHPTVNDDCEIKTRDKFFVEFEGMLKKNEGKTIVVAIHHPLMTYGTHGGHFAAEKQLFPTQKKIPLPGVASLVNHVRKSGGVSIQDAQNERYKELSKRLQSLALEAPANVVFVSGHEHSLQYIEKENIKQIISGAGSKSSAARLTGDALFTFGSQGFAVLDVFKDGSSWVRFYAQENGKPKLAFQKEVYSKDKKIEVEYPPVDYPATVETSVYTKEETEVSNAYSSFWGEHYRKEYGKKITAKVALLDTLYGGLTPIRMGGGHQTKTLRLVDKEGREFNMRALKKSAVQFLQTVVLKDKVLATEDLTQTLPEEILLDFYTAAYPYAAYPIPTMSKALGIYHTNPQLFYIPKQKMLGKYNDEYGDELYMIEERPADEHDNLESFGFSKNIESTDDFYAKLREDEKYQLDEKIYIRNRLFDMLIGDWDRHTDQWRWAEFETEEGITFRPIPRDRDQAFSDFDGAFLSSIRTLIAPAKMMQRYQPELNNLEWFNTEPMPMDRILLKNSTEEDWLAEAKFIQENLTDDVIDKAFTKVPEELQNDESLAKIKTVLKERKKLLDTIAENYFKIFNKLAVLTATDKDDFIEVTRSGKDETNVKIYRIKDGEKADLMVDKTFRKDITNEIWIYGLDDKDVFEVNGKSDKTILVRLIGGQNNDTFRINEGRKVRLYDYKSKKNTIEVNNGAKERFSDVYENNIFVYDKSKYSTYTMVPGVGFNPDAGVILGANLTLTNYGFEKDPFSTQHKFAARYHFATQGIELKYDGEAAGIFNGFNFAFGGQFNTPTFARNFFGFGNETVNNEDTFGMDYYRVNLADAVAYAGIVRRSPYGSNFSAKILFQGAEVDDVDDRFITDLNNPEEFYDWKFFTTLELGYNYESYDLDINPSRGMIFDVKTGYTLGVSGSDANFGFLKPQLGFYNRLSKDHKLVLKTNVQSHLNFGDDFEFYQAPFLGGNSGLRGYRINRFTGKNNLVFNGDVRYTFNSFKTRLLPLQIGVYGGADAGRVWVKNDTSGKWHNSFGGGVYVIGSRLINLDLSYFNSVEGNRFAFKLGVSF
ncbi:BamA/TamA family outer membrane protein [Galbibacter mesophilus]|uniref:BamA/TamA family outer membrane protein n=1 Tax=Galbibacter mesophilus TaxID=379069 RepID=UPI00191DE29A|nr:metallophosphoesterase [Galbibacter mesophilus]MCM5662682.1 metallophosphoesterase [Galbibacter mesophilus]